MLKQGRFREENITKELSNIKKKNFKKGFSTVSYSAASSGQKV